MSGANFEEDMDDPSDFKAVQLSILDEHLRCPICKEIFKDTMLLSTCSHSFCALCIRRGLSTEQICPKCRKPAYENHLIHNYDLDNVVNSWRESRQFLISMEKMAAAPKQTSIMHQQQPVQTSHSAPVFIENDDTTDDDFMPTDNLERATSRRSTRLSSQTMAPASSLGDSMQTSQSDLKNLPTTNTTATVELTRTSLVVCPICGKQMQYDALDLHIDECSSTTSTPAASKSGSASFLSNSSLSFSVPTTMKVSKSLKTSNKPINLGKKPIKQVYALMKDKDLTLLLRSFNLPEAGDRSQRIWRHKEYINLYNANYDSQHPVSANVLVQRLQTIENSQAVEKYNQSKRKTTDPNQHKAMYADQYQSLINDVKKKKLANDDGSSKKK